jgi:hypothetical protein
MTGKKIWTVFASAPDLLKTDLLKPIRSKRNVEAE